MRMRVTFAYGDDDDIDHGDDDGGDGDAHLCSQLILSSSPLSATPLLPPLLMLPSTMLTLLLFLLLLLLTEMLFDEEKLCSSIELVEFKASNMTDLVGANDHHHLFQNQLSPHLIKTCSLPYLRNHQHHHHNGIYIYLPIGAAIANVLITTPSTACLI